MATDLRDFPDIVDDVIAYTTKTRNTARLIRLLRQQQESGQHVGEFGQYVDVRLAKLLADVLAGTVPAKRKTATRAYPAWAYRSVVEMFQRAIDDGHPDVLAEVRRRKLPVNTKGQTTIAANALAAWATDLTPRQLRDRIERPKDRGKRG